MGTKLFGNINVAFVFGLAQFVTTFLIAWLLLAARRRRSSTPRRGDQVPDGGRAHEHTPLQLAAERHRTEHRPLIITLFAVFVAATLCITVWAGRQTKDARRLLRRRPLSSPASRTASRSPATTCRPRRSSASPGCHRPLRLRRLPVLHRLPGRLAGRPAAGRRAAAQLRPVHHGRRPRLPDAPAPGPYRRGRLHHRRLDLLPAGPDGGRGRARLAAARHHRRRPARTRHRRWSAC